MVSFCVCVIFRLGLGFLSQSPRAVELEGHYDPFFNISGPEPSQNIFQSRLREESRRLGSQGV